MDRGAWQATVLGNHRVGHNQPTLYFHFFSLEKFVVVVKLNEP